MSGKRSEVEFIYSSHPGLPGAASGETHRRAHSHAAQVAHDKARRKRLREYQGIMLSPTSSLGSGRSDPFASFARCLSPIKDFLLDYYMQNVVPCSTLEHNDMEHRKGYTRLLNKQFVQLAATNASSLDGPFLVTCRHLLQRLEDNRRYFIQLALQYKVACVRSLMEAISSLEMQSSISDSTVTLAIFLAQDEILIGDVTSTERHLQGAIQMVRRNDALEKTEFSAYLYDLIQKDIVNSSLMQQAVPLY